MASLEPNDENAEAVISEMSSALSKLLFSHKERVNDAADEYKGTVGAAADEAAENLESLRTRALEELGTCRQAEMAATGLLEKEKALFQKEVAAAEEQNKMRDSIVKLCVGGTSFVTSLSTLQNDPGSLLAVMFSGRHPIHKMEDGAVFIDRDPTHFRHILNYLRDGPASLPCKRGDSCTLKDELLLEGACLPACLPARTRRALRCATVRRTRA